MRLTIGRACALVLLAGPAAHAPAVAQDLVPDSAASPSQSLELIEQVWTTYFDTPSGMGLLPTAAAEARIAGQHATLALADSLYLEGARRHVAHVLHALDPGLTLEGPGLGYGVRRATQGILELIELAIAAEDGSDNLRTHATYIAGAARSVLERVDRVTLLAGRIGTAPSAAQALPTLREFEAEARAVWLGRDTDRDDRVVWAAPEGGLRQIQQHMTLLRRGEGLPLEGSSR